MTQTDTPKGAYFVELTDTFGGEANYSWVKRAYVAEPPDSVPWASRAYRSRLTRAAKAAVGLTGERGRMEEYSCGDFAFYPYGACVVMFVRWDEMATPDSEEA